ncbi:MAG: hypothetical protein M1308_09240 [Actinobacteria bacterium]|nr:hypothetical protein [Actinomycetota bacterium]
MFGFAIIGIIVLIVVGCFFPRLIASILAGIILGGGWWCLFGPVAFVGLIIDCLQMAKY